MRRWPEGRYEDMLNTSCGLVTDYDDSIGGEGEIRCGASLTVYGERATCSRGHEWVACACDHPDCRGWKVAGR